ncbi:MFS general substrate transporter [Thozetella sp. PMI_491]|nr:MFS general substrate transporter [Thozetella sp. PMI_491]
MSVEPAKPKADPEAAGYLSQGTDGSIVAENNSSEAPSQQMLSPTDTTPPWQFKGMVAMIALAAILLGYDIGNVSNMQAPIYEAMGRIELLPWVGMAMVTAGSCMIPVYRKLTGVFNLRDIMRAALILFAAGSVVGGSAKNMESIIVGRILIGSGLTGVYQVVLSYVALYASPQSAPKVMGLVGGQWALGLLSGPLVGAGFVQNPHATWRWSMYINIPFIAILFAGTFVFFPSYKAPYTGSALYHLARIDWVGCALHAGSILLAAFSFSYSGNVWPWSSGSTIALWIVAGLVHVAYIVQQTFSIFTTPDRRASYGRLIMIREVGLATIGTSMTSFCYAISMYYLPLFFAFARGYNAVETAVHFLPFLCVFITSAILSGALLPVIKRYAILYFLAGCILLTAGTLMTRVTPDTPESNVMAFGALLGIGLGMLWFNGVSVANAVLPTTDRFDTAALFNLAQFGSTGYGLAIASCLYTNIGFNTLKDSLGSFGLPDNTIREALAGVASRDAAASLPELVEQVVLGVTATMAKLFYIVVAAGSVLIMVSLLMKWHKVEFRKPTNTEKA